MKQVIVERFGGVEVLKVVEVPTPEPGPNEVRIRLTSIGMNHAELMARRGAYKASSGDPPFTPGLEGGGVIDTIGEGVRDRRAGDRVILGLDAPRGGRGGTYRSHYICDAAHTVPAPASLPDILLGAIWLSHLTAWGCLVWKQQVRAGQHVAIGLTTSREKVDRIRGIDAAAFNHIVVTPKNSPPEWHRDLNRITGNGGVDVFFDPVAAGEYLQTEIRALAPGGTIWIYGLLGEPGPVDLSPLILNGGAIRGWIVNEIAQAGHETLWHGYREVLGGFESGAYRQHVDRTFRLDEVCEAHAYMEKGQHVGKLVLVP